MERSYGFLWCRPVSGSPPEWLLVLPFGWESHSVWLLAFVWQELEFPENFQVQVLANWLFHVGCQRLNLFVSLLIRKKNLFARAGDRTRDLSLVYVWGKRFKLPQLTHESFLTIDHSCKIFFWYLPNWTSTNPWCVVLYATYSTTN